MRREHAGARRRAERLDILREGDQPVGIDDERTRHVRDEPARQSTGIRIAR